MLITISERQFQRKPPVTIEVYEQILSGHDEILHNLQLNRAQSQIYIQGI